MIICPNCRAELIDTAKFCRKCGFNIKKYKEEDTSGECFCIECGAKISADSAFCSECGTNVDFYSDSSINSNLIDSFDFSKLEREAQSQFIEQQLVAFEYEKLSTGMYVVKGLKNKAELILAVPECVQVIADAAFEGSGIMDVTLSEGLVKIGKRAFAGCIDLEKINFPASLRIIEDEAFSGCTQLDAKAPSGVRCGENAFNGTLPWQKNEAERQRKEEERRRQYTPGLEFTKKGQEYCVSGYSGKEAWVIIPEIYKDLPVTSIGKEAFRKCNLLEGIKIPGSVKTIGFYAFGGCTSLENIEISEGVTSIGNGAFSNCTSLEGIKLPDSVTSIGNGAFSNCNFLKGVVISENVTNIGSHAFYCCSSLTVKAPMKFMPHLKAEAVKVIYY